MVKIKTDKFPDVRVSQKLKDETTKAAEMEQENMSEYIRKAVEERNKKVLKERKHIPTI